jgi:transcriptional regulator with XRE-family HTH domain
MAKVIAGHWLRRRWESLGYSAASLARVSSVSRRTLTRIAAGQRVTPTIGQQLADPLKLSADALQALTEAWEVDVEEIERLTGE